MHGDEDDDIKLSSCDIYNQLRHESSKSSFIVLSHASKAFQSQRHSQKLGSTLDPSFDFNKIPLACKFLLAEQSEFRLRK